LEKQNRSYVQVNQLQLLEQQRVMLKEDQLICKPNKDINMTDIEMMHMVDNNIGIDLYLSTNQDWF